MYSKPRLFKQSIMKSLPLRPTVNGSSAGGTAVSAARLGKGTALRAGADWAATAFSGVARAAAPARPAPFRNLRRFTFGTSVCFDISGSPFRSAVAWCVCSVSAAILRSGTKSVDVARPGGG